MNGSRLVTACLALFIMLALCLGLVHEAGAGKWKRKSQQHERDCRAWCEQHKPDCDHCSTQMGCGPGFQTLKGWTGYGKNWYACQRRMSRDEATLKNSRECAKWCEETPSCVKCTNKRCGSGFKRIKSWTGRGINMYACEKRIYKNPASNIKREECQKWCDSHEGCLKCDTNKGCGKGKFAIKSWTGPGRNWHACASKATVSAMRRKACNEWCQANPKCKKCTDRIDCKWHPTYRYTVIKTFGGPGPNWYACKGTKKKK